MSRAILLDAGPLGLLCAPPGREGDAADCARWLAAHLRAKTRVLVPEMTDYEVRRELLRAGKTGSVARLDALAAATEYLPLTTAAMRRAASLWAHARQIGQPTAGDKTIDADMILIAQALTLQDTDAVIATTNVGHLSHFCAADLWQNLPAAPNPPM